MTADLPQPLVPADVDLRNFGYLQLDVLRLRDSDLAALSTGDEFKAAVMLWCVAWHQVPAASLPDDDRLLARFSGAGPLWKKVREGALRGFVKCSDGRFYHRILAEKAMESWAKKIAQRERTAAATAAREKRRREQSEQRDEQRDVARNEERNDARDERRDVQRNVHQGRGEERRGEEKKEKPSRPAAGEGLPDSPPDAGRELWANAVQMLRDQGVSESSARSFIGLQCRTWDDDTVAEAFSAAAGQANVKAYVLAVLKGKPKKGEKPAGVEFRNGQATIGGFVP